MRNSLYMYAAHTGENFCINENVQNDDDACIEIRLWRYGFEESCNEKATACCRRMYANHVFADPLNYGKKCENCSQRANNKFALLRDISELEDILDALIENATPCGEHTEKRYNVIDKQVAEKWKESILLSFQKRNVNCWPNCTHRNGKFVRTTITRVDMHTKMCIALSFNKNVVHKCLNAVAHNA